MALSTSQDGVLLRDGRPWRGYGVNYVDCFWRILRNPDDDSFRSGFSQLATLGIPFVRFAACGYWPRESELIRSRPADYWRRMDRVFNAAERNGIGLIPSLFWHYPTVPDLVGEPVGSLGEPKSLSRQWMARTIAEFAIRYRSSPALWAWEIGNETNLPADLPNASEHRPPVSVENGTPAQRSALDELSHRQVRSLLHFVASTIRRWDTQRLISSGNAFPRPTAWHQEREGSWGVDTEGQFIETLAADNPTPINSLGGRLYPEESGRFGGPISPERLLSTAMRAARSVRKPLFIGEFGSSRQEPKDVFTDRLDALVSASVPLAALWVYDFRHQQADWSVSSTGDRSYQLEGLVRANHRLKSKRPD